MVGMLVALKVKKSAARKENLMVLLKVDKRGTSWDRKRDFAKECQMDFEMAALSVA